MAKGRVISSDIWRDEFIGRLDWFEQVLWIGLFTTCADDQGRLVYDPILIRSDVSPRKDEPISSFEDAINKFVEGEKLILYEVDGRSYLQITNWWKHQKPQWASKSLYPAPDKSWKDRARWHTRDNKVHTLNWDTPGGYCVGTGVGTEVGTGSGLMLKNRNKIKNKNKVKEKESKVEIGSNSSVFNLFTIYSENIGELTYEISQRLNSLLDDYSEEWLYNAVKIAVMMNKRRLDYIEGILRNWDKLGQMVLSKADADKLEKPGAFYVDGEFSDYIQH